MHASRRSLLPVLAWVGLVAGAAPAASQDVAATRLRARLTPGSAVRIEAPGVVVADGRVVRTTADSVVVREASTSLGVALREIVTLSLERDRALQGALMGAGMAFFVGGAVGAIDGYAACAPDDDSCLGPATGRGLTWAAVAAVPGALAGWLLGRRARRWERIYP